MTKFYSDKLEQGIRKIYFQADSQQYPEGIRLMEEAVEAGEPDACYFLSRSYLWGNGNVRENEKLALELLKRGIENGSDLCVLGVERASAWNRDLQAAMKHTLEESFLAVKKTAEAGEPMAQYAIGLFYFWGDMLMTLQKPKKGEFEKFEKANGKEALKWFQESAKQGCIPAFNNAYNSQRKGQNGVEQNLKAALHLAETLKDKVDLVDYCSDIGLEYQHQNKYKDALRWYEKGSAKGDQVCLNNLGMLYLNGNGVREDEAKALSLFQEVAEAGEAIGYYNVGRCYYYGWGVKEDDHTAVEYYEKAYELDADMDDAARLLGVCYYSGYGVDKDYKKAFSWAERAVRSGNSAAKFILGQCYLYGNGTVHNQALGKRLLEENAQESPNGEVLHVLGKIYDEGLGVPEDMDLAISYYQKAIEQGCQGAEESLAYFKKSLFGKWKRRQHN